MSEPGEQRHAVDGQRNVEAVLTGPFKHEAHTLRALAAALVV